MRFCADCGGRLLALREEDDGICSECMADVLSHVAGDEDDEADDRYQQERDEVGRD